MRYKNTAAELVKRKIPFMKDTVRVYKYFKIPKERHADFVIWMEFYLWDAEDKGIIQGREDAKLEIRNALGIYCSE